MSASPVTAAADRIWFRKNLVARKWNLTIYRKKSGATRRHSTALNQGRETVPDAIMVAAATFKAYPPDPDMAVALGLEESG